MCKYLKKLADKHAILFWLLMVLIYAVLLYKLPAVYLLSDNQIGVAMLRFAIAFLIILMIKEMYHGQITLGFRKQNFGKSLLLIVLVTFIALANNILNNFPHQVEIGPLAECAIIFLSVGLYEETMVRGLLLGNMMRHWKDKPHRALKSLVWSSVIFGLLHLGNILEGAFWPLVIAQTLMAIMVGFPLGAVYIRTKNIWPLIIVHFLIDFFVSVQEYAVVEEGAVIPAAGFEWYKQFCLLGGGVVGIIISCLAQVLMVVLGLILIRKSKWAQIDKIWSEDYEPAQ